MDDEFGRDDLAAWACFRLDRLATGFRLIHLFDAQGVQSKGVLLVRVTKKFVVETPPPSAKEAVVGKKSAAVAVEGAAKKLAA